MENNPIQVVLDVLQAGGVLCYAPVNGGLVLLDDKGEIAPVRFDMMDFVNMKRAGLVEHTGHMSQGHHILHGRVNFYKKTKKVTIK